MHIFEHNHSIIIEVILNFPEFASGYKKSAQFIHDFINATFDQGSHNHF